ncbi:MAG: aminotransferase class V-fold PLP-dependent enzyme [Polyangiaceae bacterium]
MDHRIGRRRLITGLAATASAVHACAVPRTEAAPAPSTPPLTPANGWSAIRGEFSLSSEWIHAGGFLLASHPKRVREAIERHRRGLDENPVHYLGAHEDPDAVLGPASAYMGVPKDEIALTDSTTMGLATLYSGFPLRPGDEVVTTAHDHYATHESLRLAAARAGASLRKVALYARAADATEESMTAAIEGAIGEKTRLVAITWVHSSTGVKTPVRRIADALQRVNEKRSERVLLAVDGVHAFGAEDVAVGDLGCDFFVAGCHKWMFGPRGTGVLWGSAAHLALLQPTIPSFFSPSYGAWMRGELPPPTTAAMLTPGGFHSFEHRWALGEAFAFHTAIGKENVAARIRALNRQCKEGLRGMKGVTLHTPLDETRSAGIVCYEIAGHEPKAIVAHLRAKRIIGTETPYLPTYARLSFGLMNTEADVDAVLAALRELA